MKRSLITLLFALCTTLSFAQVQDTIPETQKVRRFYCEVKGAENEFSTGMKIIFDFGESDSFNFLGTLSSKLKFVDNNGQVIEFNSMIDAANYIVERGWVFQQAYSSVYTSRKPVIHWIFYKDAVSFAEAKIGIITKEEYQNMSK